MFFSSSTQFRQLTTSSYLSVVIIQVNFAIFPHFSSYFSVNHYFSNGIKETERQLDMAQENFEKISRTIKKEFEVFEARKNQDFRQTIVKYLEKMLK